MNEIEIIRPDDFHHHLRDGEVLKDVVIHASKRFSRILVMPNTKPPIRCVADALSYQERILSHIPVKTQKMESLRPLMTLYLTGNA